MPKLGRRDMIVRTALELVVERGFHGASMAMIADRAEVGVGTIYRFFENKDVLITELYRDIVESIYPILLQGYAPEKSIRERYLHLGTALLRYFTENTVKFRYIEQFYNSPYGVAYRRDKIHKKEKNSDVYFEMFEDAASQQVMKTLPLTILFALTFGPIFAVARDHILGFVTLDNALITRIIEGCWDSVER